MVQYNFEEGDLVRIKQVRDHNFDGKWEGFEGVATWVIQKGFFTGHWQIKPIRNRPDGKGKKLLEWIPGELELVKKKGKF